MNYPDHLLKLIALFKKLPGVGARSAERFAFDLIHWPEEKLSQMSQIIAETTAKLTRCAECGSLTESTCSLCDPQQREAHLLCLVANVKDVFLIEQTRNYRGLYHVFGALLSPFQTQESCDLAVQKLKERICTRGVQEVIIALDSTLEGDTTALFLKKELHSLEVTISRLALGLPMGSSLDFIDGGTLSLALQGRHKY